MPSWEEIQRSLIGAFLLWRGHPGAMAWFDLSVEGFWRSFFAALLVAPLYALLIVGDYAGSDLPASIPWLVLVHALGYLLDWISFPVVAALLVRIFDLESRYVALIVADNWASVLQALVLGTAVLLGRLTPGGAGTFLVLGAFLLVLIYQWRVARQALATSGGIAFGFVAADLLSGIMVDQFIARLV